MKYIKFYLLIFFTTGAYSIIMMFLSLYLKTKNINEINIGGLMGTYNLMLPIVILFLGFLSDRISCKKLIFLGSTISFTYCLFMPIVDKISILTILLSLGGIGYTLSYISTNVLFLKTVEGEKHGKHLSIFVASTTGGYAIGSALMSILVKNIGVPVDYIFYITVPIYFITIILSLTLPEAKIEKFPIASYYHDIRQIPLLCIAILSFAIGQHWGAESYIIIRFMEEISSSGIQMALFFIVTGLSMITLSRLSGHIVKNQQTLVRIIIPGMIISSFFHIITYWVSNFPQFLFVRFLHTCGDGIVNFCIPMWVSIIFIKSRIGGNFGFSRTINSFGVVLGNILTGFLAARFSLKSSFLATGFIQIFAAGIVWWLITNKLKPQNIPLNSQSEIIPTSTDNVE